VALKPVAVNKKSKQKAVCSFFVENFFIESFATYLSYKRLITIREQNALNKLWLNVFKLVKS